MGGSAVSSASESAASMTACWAAVGGAARRTSTMRDRSGSSST
jgi:hypothetical protein